MEWSYRRNFRKWKNIQENRSKEQMIPILYVFLSGRREKFNDVERNTGGYEHDSVMINKNEWYRFSQNKGGHAIDFMKEFYGLSFAEAVKELLGEERETDRRTAKEDAGRQKVCPSPCLDWNCQKEMKAVRLQGSISLNRENYRNNW